MSDILYATILMSFFIGGSICAVGICIVQKFDDLKHEIWELRMDLQDEKPEEPMKVDVVPSGMPFKRKKEKNRNEGMGKVQRSKRNKRND